MAHKFSMQSQLHGLSMLQVKDFAKNPSFHEKIAAQIPGSNLEIISSTLTDKHYEMTREYNLDVNIPDVAKKFLKGAFRVRREDKWNLADLSYQSRITMNMPAEFISRSSMRDEGGQLVSVTEFEVDVRIPLVHGMLARHAEGEIRHFANIELGILHQELLAALA